MKKIGAFDAKTRLSALLEAAEYGEEVFITKHSRPVAKLTPLDDIDAVKLGHTIEWLQDFREKHPIRGLKIRDLIDEGRKH
jgi:prevent-host-death family protein